MKKILVAVLLLFPACSRAPEQARLQIGLSEAQDEAMDRAERSPAPAAPSAVSAERSTVALDASPALEPVAAPENRMIIRNADLQLVAARPESTAAAIAHIAKAQNGYVTDSRQWRENGAMRADLTLRVPAERLDETLRAIRSTAMRTESESVTGQDVTAEHTDLSARLRNLQATEVELRELLKTARERAQRASDILEVYNQLTNVRGQIEQTRGRMQYLSQMTAFSTIHVSLLPDVVSTPVASEAWRPLAAAHRAVSELIATFQVLGNALIWMVIYAVPIGLLLLIPIYALVRVLRVRRWRFRNPLPRRSGT